MTRFFAREKCLSKNVPQPGIIRLIKPKRRRFYSQFGEVETEFAVDAGDQTPEIDSEFPIPEKCKKEQEVRLAENLANRVACVFFSSTFRDMKVERDYLMTRVAPAMRVFCKQRDVAFVPIDLRWGVTTEEANNGLTAELCLMAIERSRPFFIGLLGERYGWIPEKNDISPRTNERFPFIDADVNDRMSITEMEIQYGVLRSVVPIDAAFWFRSGKMPTPEEFREKPESLEARKLAKLKVAIHESGRPVAEYDSPEDLCQQVETSLKEWICREFPEEGIGLFAKQNREQNAFVRSRKRLYVPRLSDFTRITESVAAAFGNAVVLSAPSGYGKSSLLANWSDSDTEKEKLGDVKIITHFVGTSENSDNPAHILHRLTAFLDPARQEIGGADKDSSLLRKEGKTLDDCKTAFRSAIATFLSENIGKRLVVVIDGLDRLAEWNEAKKLNWLPTPPSGASYLLSTVSEDATLEVAKRRGWTIEELAPLAENERRDMIVKFLSDSHRKLDEELCCKIARCDLMKNPLVLRALLDEMTLFADHFYLENDLIPYLEANDENEFFDIVFDRLERTCDAVKIIVPLIVASRYGLSDDELLEITGLLPLKLWTVLNTLDSHLVCRSGLFAFNHTFIKEAALKRYANCIDSARRKLVEYFNSEKVQEKAVERTYRETPWQLRELEDWEALYSFIGDPQKFVEMYDGTLNCDLCEYWSALFRVDGDKYAVDVYLEKDYGNNDKERATYWNKVGVLADEFKRYEVAERAYQSALAIRRELCRDDPKIFFFDIPDTLNRLGSMHAILSRYDEADKEYREALAIRHMLAESRTTSAQCEQDSTPAFHLMFAPEGAETLFDYDGSTARLLVSWANLCVKRSSQEEAELAYLEALAIYRELEKSRGESYKSGVATILHNLGTLHKNRRLYDKAEKEYDEALEIRRGLARKDPETFDGELATSLNSLGMLHYSLQRYDEAEKEYSEAHEIRRRLAQAHPEVFKDDLANTLNCLGVVHDDLERFGEAEKEYSEALEIRRELAQAHPEAFVPRLATTLHNIALLHKKLHRYDTAEQEYLEALELRRELAQKNPETFNRYVADTLSNLALLRLTLLRFDEAEKGFNEAIELYVQLDAKEACGFYKSKIVGLRKELEILNFRRVLSGGKSVSVPLDNSDALNASPDVKETSTTASDSPRESSLSDADPPSQDNLPASVSSSRVAIFKARPYANGAEILGLEDDFNGETLVIPDAITLTINGKDVETPVVRIGSEAFVRRNSSFFLIPNTFTSVVLPKGLLEIGEGAFSFCSSLKSISLPEGLTRIDDKAFYQCSSLESIRLPEGLKELGKEAFVRCDSLMSAMLPTSLTDISDEAFSNCRSLERIEVDDKSETFCSIDGVLFSKDGKTLVLYPGGKDTKYVVPEGVEKIGKCAFDSCCSLSAVVLPKTLVQIDDKAFDNCKSLKSIAFPDGLREIGDYAFSECASLSEITLPDSLTRLGDRAFDVCCYLTSITFSDGLIDIGEFAFSECESLTYVTLPKKLTEIRKGTFWCCTALKSIKLPEGLLKIGDKAFDGCESLRSISLPEGLTEIGSEAFVDNYSLKSVELPASVAKVGDDAFPDTTLVRVKENSVGKSSEEPSESESTLSEALIAESLISSAVGLRDRGRYEEAEGDFVEALGIYRRLAQDRPEEFNCDVASTLRQLAELHDFELERHDEAENEYRESLAIYRWLATGRPDDFNCDVASLLCKLADLHGFKLERYDEAECEYREALDIYRNAADDILGEHDVDLAYALGNLAFIHRLQERWDEAEKEYAEARAIYGKLAENNSVEYNVGLALMIRGLAFVHEQRKRWDEAEKEYADAIAIYRKLAKKNPEDHNHSLASSLVDLATLHFTTRQYSAAQKEYAAAYAIYVDLEEKNPGLYEEDVSSCRMGQMICNLHIERGKSDE